MTEIEVSVIVFQPVAEQQQQTYIKIATNYLLLNIQMKVKELRIHFHPTSPGLRHASIV